MARPYPGSAYPASPAPTTASSLNYSQYGASPATSRSNTGPSSSYSGSRAPPMAPMRSVTSSSTGLKPPAGKKDSREIARVHWQALKDFLREWLQNESPTARASAREKLTRLTKLQFQELSTDVYDELSRRIEVESGPPSATAPFLPVRDDFHPKRNQARQKLATLPKNRFKDLASDVYYELRRRYPEFEEEVGDQLKCEAYGQTQEMMYEEPRAPSRSERPAHQRQGSRQASVSSNTAPQYNSTANDVVIPNKSRLREEDAPSPFDNRPDKPGTSRNDVIIPNKSRMREEEIEVPYARDSSLVDDRPTSAASSRRLSRISQASSYKPAATPRAEPAPDMLSPQSNDDRNYYERLSFSSNVTSKSKMPAAEDEREQKIRSDYELRIAGLERRALAAESERDECRRREVEEKEKRVEWEDEVRGLKERAALHASALRSMQHELDLARDAATTARQHMEESSRHAQEEIDQWRDRCEGLEDNLRNAEADRSISAPNNDAVAELRNEIHSLVAELNSLSARNDDLVGEREQDAQTMNEMEARVADYKRKYDSVRIELRNLKATSTMFTSKPLSDDHLPASPDGNISDINVSSFQNAIDGMLTAARSSTPSGVLPAMKAIVEAITEIGEDVKSFEAKPNLDVDVSRLESLKHESTARLNGLMQAARNHAMASGLSPVSLIDAAAGHLSANVVEIIKLLKIRRSRSDAPRAEPMQRQRSSLSIKDMVNRDVRRPDLLEPQRQLSIDSSSSRLGEKLVSPTESRLNGITGAVGGMLSNFRVNSFQSSRSDSFDLERKASVASSYDRPTPKAQVSYGRDSPISTSSSAPPPEQEEDIGGSAQEWEEVKPYLETQSSALVNSIQNLLAAIRTGGQTPALNEHLSEVIAIASSIVAVSTNALPSSLKGEGGPLLRDLVTNTNRLSEAQEQAKTGGFDKAVRQVIASASFGVAKSLKALMKLGTE